MQDLYMEQVKNFINDFYNIYNSDKYISKKELDDYYDKYIDIIELSKKYDNKEDQTYKNMMIILEHGNEIIDKKNKKYIERKLIEEKDYFDSMFINVDPNIKLDEEQRKAILIDEDYSLIVAGAGSGKTTTMAAKVKYLIEKKHVNPNSIILLSFTNSSVNDLSELINNKFKLNVEVLTFHKLGMKFLRGTEKNTPQIIDDSGMFKLIEEFFIEHVFKNKKLLTEYRKYFSKQLRLSDECINYNTYEEYYNNYIERQYNKHKDNLKEEINKRISNRTIYNKTIKGEQVKSLGEVKIANYLYKHGIDYEYEKPYPFHIMGNKSYKPDFTINTLNPIYIEYYGLASLNNDNIVESDSEKYKKEISIKRKTHLGNKTDLIEIFGRYETYNSQLDILRNELDKRNVLKKLRTDKEIFYKLLETSKTFSYMNLIKLFITFIKIYKEKGNKLKDFEYYIDNCKDEQLKTQLKLLREVYIYYEQKKSQKYQIDFQDMINNAYDNIEKYKEIRNTKYDYVIIDEYQDISRQRNNFTKKISDIFNSKIVAVGDDWQTIYSFSGSDIELFLKFSENMGYCEEIKITNTYRNSQELIDIAGEFVLQNNSQIEKKLYSIKHLDKPVQLVEYEFDEEDLTCENFVNKLEDLIINIYEDHPNDKILLLSRFNEELDILLRSKKFYKNNKYEKEIFLKKIPDAKIDFLTVHKSKGLGYDRVILLNAINGLYGFPSQIKDEPVIKYIKGELDNKTNTIDIIEYPEERRLFYVALTRTKNELYIMTPSVYKYKSDFIKEIEQNKNVEIYS